MRPGRHLGRRLVHGLIRAYQLSLSALVGRECRYLPTCSDYADEAVRCHGVWYGGWMATARICRCHPFGSSGFDPVPQLPSDAQWTRAWRYARWRGPDAAQDRASIWADNA